jgi:hypothetical protein
LCGPGRGREERRGDEDRRKPPAQDDIE